MAAHRGQTHLSLRVHQAKTPGRQMAGQDRKPLLGREEGVGMRCPRDSRANAEGDLFKRRSKVNTVRYPHTAAE